MLREREREREVRLSAQQSSCAQHPQEAPSSTDARQPSPNIKRRAPKLVHGLIAGPRKPVRNPRVASLYCCRMQEAPSRADPRQLSPNIKPGAPELAHGQGGQAFDAFHFWRPQPQGVPDEP